MSPATLTGMRPLLRSVRRGIVPGAALVLAAALGGCGGTHHSSPARKSSSNPSNSSVIATRWWSNSAVTVGSKISSAHPEAAAANLHPSHEDYCGMLKQTIASRKSILPGVTATDPALLTSTKAFVAEIERVAPAPVTAQWQMLGPVILALVKSGGDLKALPTVDLGVITKAGTEIAADSLKNCGVDLSPVLTAVGG